jgi:hypothetical protein
MSGRAQVDIPARICRPYILALLLAALINGALRIQIAIHYWRRAYYAGFGFDLIRNSLALVFSLLLIVFLVRLISLVPRLWWTRQPIAGGELFWLGLISTLQLTLNLVSVNVTIYRLKIASYELLAESIALYSAINLIFLFWYWYADYPLRGRQAIGTGRAGVPLGILFPEEEREKFFMNTETWIPKPIDYFYFTILSSNCFGSPEGHCVIGSRLKLIQIVHTVFMIFVFIIIVARAINTLA